MTDSEIIELLGGVTAVSRMLDIKPPSVHTWLTDGIPDGRLRELAGQIELRSGGRFSRRARWPDKYAFYWPELAHVQQAHAPAESHMTGPLTTDAALEADLEKAEQAGLVHLPKRVPPWNGVERRVAQAQRRAVDRERDGAADGQVAAVLPEGI